MNFGVVLTEANMAVAISTIALLLSVVGLVLARKGHFLAKEAFKRDTLLKIQEHAIANKISDKFSDVARMKNFTSYDEFFKDSSSVSVSNVEQVVSHLNYCAQLVDEGYLNQQLVWNRYFWMYRISGDKLCDWWLEYHQSIHDNKFINFKRMCSLVCAVPGPIIERFDLEKEGGHQANLSKQRKAHIKVMRQMSH